MSGGLAEAGCRVGAPAPVPARTTDPGGYGPGLGEAIDVGGGGFLLT
jgi:hypothetical protein